MIGNSKSNFVQIGASNHSDKERALNDYYSTDPNSLVLFLRVLERDQIVLHNDIWECACGRGHISKVLEQRGYNVYSSDLVDRGYGRGGVDFLKVSTDQWQGDILTNPPYKYAKEFVEKSLQITKDGFYTIMYLKIQFLEGKNRRNLFKKYPPKYIYVNSSRQLCLLNGDIKNKMSSAVCYCWFMWEKGFKGEPTVRWI